MESSLEDLKYSSNTVIGLNMVGFYCRMLHLAALYPDLAQDFLHYRSNISVIASDLQKSEFWLVNRLI